MDILFIAAFIIWIVCFVLMMLRSNKKDYRKYQVATVIGVILQWIIILIWINR